MPITSMTQDPEALTLTIVADFPVPVRRLWDAYADPRQIERFWGPPGWPATFTRHDMAVGGQSHYAMTGPDGESAPGYWEFLAVEEGVRFEVLDGFANQDGTPNTEMPTMRMEMNFESTETGSRLVSMTYFNSLEQLEELVAMGMVEGTRAAMGQIDEVLADLASFAVGNGTQVQLLGHSRARISRVIRGSVEQVWEAHHDPEPAPLAARPRWLEHAGVRSGPRRRRYLPLRVGERFHGGSVRVHRDGGGDPCSGARGHHRVDDRDGRPRGAQ